MSWNQRVVENFLRDAFRRIRITLSSAQDSVHIVDQITPELVEAVAGDVCATLGIDYEVPEGQQPAQGGDKAGKARAKSPWNRRKGMNLSPKRPDMSKL